MKKRLVLVAIFAFINLCGHTQGKIYNVLCEQDKTYSDGIGGTLEPLEVVSSDLNGQSQVVRYRFDTRHNAFRQFKSWIIPRDSFSVYMNKYLIDTANLYKWEKENELLILLKKGNDGTCMIIPDINHSGKFSDDSVYFSRNPQKDKVIIQYSMSFWYIKKYKRQFEFVILPDPLHVPKKYATAVYNTWGGARKIMTGKLQVGLDSFKVSIILPGNSIYYTKFNSKFSFSAPNENYIPIYKTGYPIYSFTDSVSVGDKILMLDTLSILGDTLVFKEVGENPLMKGVQKGAILKSIEGKNFLTDKYEIIDLQRNDRKFTLLHFWGSWCAPCIENLPKLNLFYENYKERVQIIGFPYESKQDTVKGKRLIKEHNMYWTQIIQLRNDPFQKADVVKELRIDVFPTYILLDSTGKILIRSSNISEVEACLK